LDFDGEIQMRTFPFEIGSRFIVTLFQFVFSKIVVIFPKNKNPLSKGSATMVHSDAIAKIRAREVLNFRGNPTVEAEVFLKDGSYGKAAVPAGISTGSSEAVQILDGDPKRFNGKGALKAVENVRKVIAPALKGMKATRQKEIDEKLIGLDGTPGKSRLGANAILGVSLAAANAAAASRKVPLFRYLGGRGPFRLPVPVYDMLAGGSHAQSTVDLQEYLVIPAGLSTFDDAIQAGFRIYQALREVLQAKGHRITQVGGPLTPSLKSNREGVEVVAEAIEKAGYKLGKEVFIGIDAATSELYEDGKYLFKGEGRTLTSQEMVELWAEWVAAYPIVSIEDPLAEEDWEGWQAVTKRIGNKVQLVGDDLFTTNPARIRKGSSWRQCCPHQAQSDGTLTETLRPSDWPKSGFGAMISSRSGETEDTAISDLSVLTARRSNRPPNLQYIVKFNRLLRIAEELGSRAKYAGHGVIKGAGK
jgi:enolase